jgi:uncharacterized protein YkwD
VTLALLGFAFVSACDGEIHVVAPSEPTASTTSMPGAGEVAGQASTTTALTSTTTAPPTTESTLPPTTAPPETTPPDDPNQPYEGPEAESLAFVNERRAENGLHALEVDPALTTMADDWAQQIAADQDLRHNPNLGEQAPDGYNAVGENVGYAWEASVIDNGWWESDGHRENILRRSYDAIGIAFVVDGEGTVWGVQVFAGG